MANTKKKVKKQEVYYHEFEPCEICGERPAIRRHWNDKVLCSYHAKISFQKFLVALVGVVVVVIGLLVIG